MGTAFEKIAIPRHSTQVYTPFRRRAERALRIVKNSLKLEPFPSERDVQKLQTPANLVQTRSILPVQKT
jgi:hypothetical protein